MRPTCPKDLHPWAWASEYTLVSIYLVCLLILNQSFLHSNSQKNKRVNALFKNVIYIAQRFALVLLHLLRLGEGRFIDFVPSIFLYLVLWVVGDGIC